MRAAGVVVHEAMKPATMCKSGGRCLSFASSLVAGPMLLTTVAGVSAAPGDVIGVLHHPNAMEHRPFFGASLAVYGDRLVVGAPLADRENVDTGIAFLMDVESGEVLREFRNPTPNPQERFGSSIAVSGDRILIGVPGGLGEEPEPSLNNVGRAYVFDGESGELLLTLANPDGTILNRFGEAVAFLGAAPIVGAPFNALGHDRSGGAYIFDGVTGGLLLTLKKSMPEDDHFGQALAVSGERIFVGAPFDGASGTKTGGAYLFTDGSADPELSFFHPHPSSTGSFGAAIAAMGEGVLIADPRDGSEAANGGAVFVFEVESGKLLRTLRRIPPFENGHFGTSLAAAGDDVLIGAPGDRPAPGGRGRAYLFNGRTGGLLLHLRGSTAEPEDNFGSSVAFLGSLLVVGAPLHDGGKGAVFILEGNDGTIEDPCTALPAEAIDGPVSADCNENGAADHCDIVTGFSADCDVNGAPDECQLPTQDCNLNGMLDVCEIRAGLTTDCDADGRPDQCLRAAEDCNQNGVPDACDIATHLELKAPRGYPVLERIGIPVASDLDGDGLVDVAIGTSGQPDLAILQNLGGRSYSPPHRISAGAIGQQQLAVADYNGDGLLDLATSNQFVASVSVLLSEGALRFRTPLIQPVGPGPGRLIAVDLDGDDDPDLAVVDDGKVSLLFNDGSGIIDSVTTLFDEDGRVLSIEAGDVDGDGDVDVVATSAEHYYFIVIFNEGFRTFTAGPQYATRDTPGTVEAADLDMDGDLDLVLSHRDSVDLSVFRNRGDGVFEPAERYNAAQGDSLAIGDLDGDDDLDIARGGFSMLRNRGDGSFDSSFFSQNRLGPLDLVAADLDLDDRIDLFWTGFRSLDILWNEAGSFPAMDVLSVFGTEPSMTVAADWNGDGTVDVAVAAREGPVSIFDQRNGAFTARALSFESPFIMGADLNTDGSADLIAFTAVGLEVLLNDGTGAFLSGGSLDADGVTVSATVVDLDGDGYSDVVSANPVSDIARGSLSVLRGNGDGTFSSPQNLPVNAEPLSVVGLDLDGDGDVDLASLNREPLSISVFLKEAAGAFGLGRRELLEEIKLEQRPFRASLAHGDFNADGSEDLVAFLAPDPALRLFFSDGGGGFARRTAIEGTESPLATAATDLDADGDIDMAVSGLGMDAVTLYMNDGSGGFIPGVRLVTGHSPAAVTVADIDGNGFKDLIVTDLLVKSVSIVRGGLSLPFSGDVNEDEVPDECGTVLQLVGDCNQDGSVNLPDALCLLGTLFDGEPPVFPCGDGLSIHPANVALLDWREDGRVNITDAIALLKFLFTGVGADEASPCRAIAGCAASQSCR